MIRKEIASSTSTDVIADNNKFYVRACGYSRKKKMIVACRKISKAIRNDPNIQLSLL